MADLSTWGVHIGLTDEAEEGVFIWYQTNAKPTWVNWFGVEPNLGVAENCVATNTEYSEFGWSDVSCDHVDPATKTLCEHTLGW